MVYEEDDHFNLLHLHFNTACGILGQEINTIRSVASEQQDNVLLEDLCFV